MGHIYPVILCGGSGTRLWPLSRRDFPKQFALALDGKSLFEAAFERASSHPLARQTICIANSDYRFLVREVTDRSSAPATLILEPVARNTAAAIASVALHVLASDPDAVIVCVPADHRIAPTDKFHDSLTNALAAARAGWITILGIAPTHASTSYGYLSPGTAIDGATPARRVDRFIEKPVEEQARAHVRDGYLWNSGMVVARADAIVEALKRHAPSVLDACREAMLEATLEYGNCCLDETAFSSAPSISFDHAVLEKHDRVAMVDFEGTWSDVGSWTELAELHPADGEGNRNVGDAVFAGCKRTFIHNADRLTVAVGLEDVIIIDTADALLVADRGRLDELKPLVGDLVASGRSEALSHQRVARPWGSYESVDRGENFQVKRITVKPGGVLSLQFHRHRAEHWVVVKGEARVTCGERQFLLKQNQSTYIPQGVVHRLENPGTEPLELIEVQSGSYLGEDDIVRLSDTYGRTKEASGSGG